jgi:hypothetical protein
MKDSDDDDDDDNSGPIPIILAEVFLVFLFNRIPDYYSEIRH